MKNRFGPADEVGCFELADGGIAGWPTRPGCSCSHRDAPVAGHLRHRHRRGPPRRCRPRCRRWSAPTRAGNPRRAVSGPRRRPGGDGARGASTERGRRAAVDRDVYTATVGGVRLTEPADRPRRRAGRRERATGDALPRRRRRPSARSALSGEVRPVGRGWPRRLAEAARLGLTGAVLRARRGRSSAIGGCRPAQVVDACTSCGAADRGRGAAPAGAAAAPGAADRSARLRARRCDRPVTAAPAARPRRSLDSAGRRLEAGGAERVATHGRPAARHAGRGRARHRPARRARAHPARQHRRADRARPRQGRRGAVHRRLRPRRRVLGDQRLRELSQDGRRRRRHRRPVARSCGPACSSCPTRASRPRRPAPATAPPSGSPSRPATRSSASASRCASSRSTSAAAATSSTTAPRSCPAPTRRWPPSSATSCASTRSPARCRRSRSRTSSPSATRWRSASGWRWCAASPTEIEGYVVELGTDGRLLSLQLDELMAGVEGERELVVRDYLVEGSGRKRRSRRGRAGRARRAVGRRPARPVGRRQGGRLPGRRRRARGARSARAATGCSPRCPRLPRLGRRPAGRALRRAAEAARRRHRRPAGRRGRRRDPRAQRPRGAVAAGRELASSSATSEPAG